MALEDDWIDVTQTMCNGMVHWPGQVVPEFKLVSSIEKGDMANSTEMRLNAHTGTHMDAPLHFIAGGADMASIPIKAMMGEGKIFLVEGEGDVTKEKIQQAEERVGVIEEGDRILFRTRFSSREWIGQEYDRGYPGLSRDAAEYLVHKKVLLTGIDYLSIAPYGDLQAVHQILLGSGVWVVEGLKLAAVEEGRYEILSLPLKIAGADGSPARVLVRPMK